MSLCPIVGPVAGDTGQEEEDNNTEIGDKVGDWDESSVCGVMSSDEEDALAEVEAETNKELEDPVIPEDEQNVIATARSRLTSEMNTSVVHAIECTVPIVGERVKADYAAQKDSFRKSAKLDEKEEVQELLLFHGTSLESVNGIAENNFDLEAAPSCPRSKAMALGRGVYLSSSARTSLQYGSTLLLCKVLPGRTEEFESRAAAGCTLPIATAGPGGWDSRRVGSVWVVTRPSQVLPYCVVHCYLHRPESVTSSFQLQGWRGADRPRPRDPASTSSVLIRKELEEIYSSPRPGLFVTHEKDDTLFKIHILVTGPYDTVLEGGLFHFQLYCPPDYPFTAPSLQLLTGRGSPSLHRVLGSQGSVLLPLLHRDWGHSLGLLDVLSSLQAALASPPFRGPGWDPSVHRALVQHCTLQTAVLEGFQTGTLLLASPIRQAAREVFLDSFCHYREVCCRNQDRDGEEMVDHLGQTRGRFQFRELLEMLEGLKLKLEEEPQRCWKLGSQPHFQAVVAGTSSSFTLLHRPPKVEVNE